MIVLALILFGTAAVLWLLLYLSLRLIVHLRPSWSRRRLMLVGIALFPALMLALVILGFVELAFDRSDTLDDAPQRSLIMAFMILPFASLLVAPLGLTAGWCVARRAQSRVPILPETFE